MKDISKTIMAGRLTKDAELTYTNSGYAVTKFSIAVNDTKKDGDQWKDEADFFNCTMWGKRGEALHQYLTKGKQVLVEGRMKQSRWTDKSTGQNRQSWFLRVDEILLAGGAKGEQSQKSGTVDYDDYDAPAGNEGRTFEDDTFDDSIPF